MSLRCIVMLRAGDAFLRQLPGGTYVAANIGTNVSYANVPNAVNTLITDV